MENSLNNENQLDTGEIRTMDSKSKNIEIIMGNETDDIIEELFNLFCKHIKED